MGRLTASRTSAGGRRNAQYHRPPYGDLLRKFCPGKPKTEVTLVTLQPLFPSALSGFRVQYITMLAVFSVGGLCFRYLQTIPYFLGKVQLYSFGRYFDQIATAAIILASTVSYHGDYTNWVGNEAFFSFFLSNIYILCLNSPFDPPLTIPLLAEPSSMDTGLIHGVTRTPPVNMHLNRPSLITFAMTSKRLP